MAVTVCATSAALASFVAAWRRLAPSPEAALASQVSAFVDRWRAASAFEAGQALLTPERLTAVVAQLGPALEGARRTGAFVNIWRVAGLGRRELRNASALAWLLDPRETHGLGDQGLQAFFDVLQAAAPDCLRPARL